MVIKQAIQPCVVDVPLAEFTPVGSTIELKSADHVDATKRNFNPFDERQNKSFSDLGATAHILKGSLGTGILAMPNAFKNAGLIFGAVLTLLVGALCTHCIHMLVSTSHYLCWKTRRPQLTFSETAEEAFKTGWPPLHRWSRPVKIFVNSALCATYYSTGVVYVVFIATSLKPLGDVYLKKEMDVRLYMVMLWLPLSLMVSIRKLKYLVPFSALSNILIIGSFGITMYYIFNDMPSPETREYIASASQLPIFFSTVIFAMEGIGVVMPIENSMKKPQHFLSCPGVINVGMGIVIALYAIIGFCGYLKYGDATSAAVTGNLPEHETLAEVVQFLLAVAIIFTFGLQIHVPNEISWSGLRSRVTEKWHLVAEYGLRMVSVFLIVLIAVALPNLEPVISLVGAVCFSTLGLLCPAIIDSAAHWGDCNDRLGSWRHIKNGFIAACSLVALVTGAYTSILSIIATYG